MTVYRQTIFEISWGDGKRGERRYFRAFHHNDAIVRFAERVVDLDRDPTVYGAYVTLARLGDTVYPDGKQIASWTKTSDERPTEEGALSPEGLSGMTL